MTKADPLAKARERGKQRKQDLLRMIATELEVNNDDFMQVIDALGSHDFWMIAVFLLSPSDRLYGKTPIFLLKTRYKGYAKEVVEEAKMFGEHGAA